MGMSLFPRGNIRPIIAQGILYYRQKSRPNFSGPNFYSERNNRSKF